jgi:hypothetical protein
VKQILGANFPARDAAGDWALKNALTFKAQNGDYLGQNSFPGEDEP